MRQFEALLLLLTEPVAQYFAGKKRGRGKKTAAFCVNSSVDKLYCKNMLPIA